MNMKKKILSAAIIAAAGVGSAQAVHLSQDGTGQVVLLPYYTVNGGHKTLVSIVNTTDQFKAVKVRFREGMNSREVLDFNLYLSPYDVWVGSVQEDGKGGAKVMQGANETSCTTPAIPADGEEFKDFAYTGSTTGLPADGGGADRKRMTEGYIEILEMGNAPYNPTSPSADHVAVWKNGPTGRYHAKHYYNAETGRMEPNNCSALVANFTSGKWRTALNEPAKVGLNPPSGGLMGSASIINVEFGTQLEVPPTVLGNVFDDVVHYNPGTLLPNLDEAGKRSDNESVSHIFYGGEVYESDWVNHLDAVAFGKNAYNKAAKPEPGAFAVAAALQAQSIMNEFTVNPATEAETSWVVTFPIRWAFADGKTDGHSAGSAISPFTTKVSGGKGSERFSFSIVNRDEADMSSDVVFSPMPIGGAMDLPYEVNVINFGDSDVFSSNNKIRVSVEDVHGTGIMFDSGWAKMEFLDGEGKTRWGHALVDTQIKLSGTDENAGKEYRQAYMGLPVIGFRASVLGNANVGIGAAYGSTSTHTFNRVTGLFDWGVFPAVTKADGTMLDDRGYEIFKGKWTDDKGTDKTADDVTVTCPESMYCIVPSAANALLQRDRIDAANKTLNAIMAELALVDQNETLKDALNAEVKTLRLSLEGEIEDTDPKNTPDGDKDVWSWVRNPLFIDATSYQKVARQFLDEGTSFSSYSSGLTGAPVRVTGEAPDGGSIDFRASVVSGM